jgi:hypothetical protein
MFRYYLQFLTVLFFSSICQVGYPQVVPVVGHIEVKGNLIGTKGKELERKRFYLFRGGLAENKTLIEKLKAADFPSRDCYFCQKHASAELMAWLKAWNCESPYCREITTDDIARVPEFQAAYQKGLKQFRDKPILAQKWLTTNLEPSILDGFYQQRKSLIKTLLDNLHPVEWAVADGDSVARFVDIPLKAEETAETFLISNVVPIEVGEKSYIWACDVEISSDGSDPLILKVPVNNKPVKQCEVIVKDLPVCNAASCK